MSKKKVIIIGAGPAGLSCALKLVKLNYDVHIYEAGPEVGGMSRSFNLWNQIVDLGPHRFFSKNKEINEFFKEVVKEDYTIINRLTRIYYNKKFFNYPLKIGNVLTNLNLIVVLQILFYYFLQRIRPIKNPKSFEEWVTNRFGIKLYEIFFKNYSEKLWGIPCTEIDADWAAQRIKSLSLFEAVKSALIGNASNKHKTLVDQFAYPNLGTGMIYTNCSQLILKNGGHIHLSTPVKTILTDQGECIGIELANNEKVYGDIVVSTMPLTLMIRGLQNVPQKVHEANRHLTFRNTTLVYLEIDSDELFKDNWIYIHSPTVKHGRITNFRNWSPHLCENSKNSILCLEYWSFDEDDLWNLQDDQLISLASKELRQIGLIHTSHNILQGKVVRVPRCYPVYKTGYADHLNIIIQFLKQINQLHLIGRYGSFKYNNQDHSILMGLLCAENIILNKQKTNLWSINTDTEYQEEGVIKDVLIS